MHPVGTPDLNRERQISALRGFNCECQIKCQIECHGGDHMKNVIFSYMSEYLYKTYLPGTLLTPVLEVLTYKLEALLA